MAPSLPPGLYELLIHQGLEHQLAALQALGQEHQAQELESTNAAPLLAEFLGKSFCRRCAPFPGRTRWRSRLR